MYFRTVLSRYTIPIVSNVSLTRPFHGPLLICGILETVRVECTEIREKSRFLDGLYSYKSIKFLYILAGGTLVLSVLQGREYDECNKKVRIRGWGGFFWGFMSLERTQVFYGGPVVSPDYSKS